MNELKKQMEESHIHLVGNEKKLYDSIAEGRSEEIGQKLVFTVCDSIFREHSYDFSEDLMELSKFQQKFEKLLS